VSSTTAPSAPIGIFGGTFDPVHFGHLRPVLEVLEELQLAEIRLIPCHIPPHRASPKVSADHRLDLLQAAIAGVPGLVADERELRRSGPSYTVDTLASLRGEFPHASLCLILGMDSFLGLPRWHRWQELARLAHLVVLDRPGNVRPVEGELAEWLAERRVDSPARLGTTSAGAVYFHPVTQLDISATKIRRLIADGRPPRFLMPEAVWQRIAAQGLYGWRDRVSPTTTTERWS
jgi:nicotinate-nucleotide adenylyltransferase